MDRRSQLRIAADQKVVVTLLGRQRRTMHGRIVDISGKGLRLLIPERGMPGDPLKIVLEDALLLGEICYCRREDRGFLLGIELNQALNGLAALAQLNRALLEHDRADRRAILPVSEQT